MRQVKVNNDTQINRELVFVSNEAFGATHSIQTEKLLIKWIHVIVY